MELFRLFLKDRRVRLFIACLVTLLLLIWLLRYLTTGRVIINTNDHTATVVLSRLDKNNVSTEVKRGRAPLSYRGSSGNYLATVRNRSFATKQTVVLKSRQTLTYRVDVKTGGVLEPVLSSGAFAVISDANQLLYLDSSSGNLYSISSDGTPAAINPSLSFKGFSWADTDFGIGLATDGKLYSYMGGQLSQLVLPFDYTSGVNYAVTKQRDIFVTSGGDVMAGGVSGGFHKVYGAHINDPSLIAGNSHVVALDSKKGSAKGESSTGETLLAVLNTHGTLATKETGAYEVAWSPDDTRLAISSDLASVIYTPTFKKISTYPEGNVSGLAWIDNNTIVYGVGTALWSYSLQAKQASLITSATQTGGISNIFTGRGGDYIYLDTANLNGSGYQLMRIGLRGQFVPDYIYKLGVFLPLNLAPCAVNFENFKQPAVVMSPYSAPSADECIGLVKSTLQDDQIDTGRLRFITLPAQAMSD